MIWTYAAILAFLGVKSKNSPKMGQKEPKSAKDTEEMSSESFDRAMEFVLRWEGGYVNHPNDPGGETNFGIAKRSHPEVDIKNLTEESAKAIYRKDYWSKIHGDDLPGLVALVTMDYAVNSGTGRAVKTLQKVAGAVQDGVIGPNTIKAIQSKVEDIGEKAVARLIVMERAIFLSRLVQSKTNMAIFLVGWMKRTHSLMAEAMLYE